ncbi:MAG: type II toxin-antitoxin system RelE/ParE family toxin [Acidobacteriota bacterium]
MSGLDKPLAWLHGENKTPRPSTGARIQTGPLLRRLQCGERIEMPHSRPMPIVGPGCLELRIQDGDLIWRVIYWVDPDAVIICDVFAKKTRATPRSVIESCRRRLTAYDAIASGKR